MALEYSQHGEINEIGTEFLPLSCKFSSFILSGLYPDLAPCYHIASQPVIITEVYGLNFLTQKTAYPFLIFCTQGESSLPVQNTL